VKRAAWSAIAASACLLAAAVPPAAAEPLEPLGHVGRWITDADGRVVILHGAAVVPSGFTSPIETAEQAGFTREDAEFLARHGFNVVRLGIFYGGYETQPNVFDEAYLDSAARTHGLLSDAGIFTVLDFHQDMLAQRYQGRGFAEWFLDDDGVPNQPQLGFPGNYFFNAALNRAYDNLWANAAAPDGVGLQEHFAAGWRRVAQRFASSPRIAGYDLLNEPWPGSEWPSCANPEGCPPGGFDQTKLTAFHDRVIAAIRVVDTGHLAFYEPNLQFDVGAKTGHGKAADPNVGMSFHNYCLGAAPGLPRVPDPAGACRDQGERRVFQNAEEHSERTGATLLMTEFGDVEDAEIHARVADLADEFMVGWTVWAWFRSTGQIKRDPARPPTPDNLRQETLAAVVRPYPRVVAGTPVEFGFDRETKRFSARFSTNLPAGMRAGDRESEVFVPALHFGDRYRVDLAGAELVGGLGTQLLRVRACPGAAAVSMTVTDEAPADTLTCPERGRAGTPPAPSGRRIRCPRGNSRTVRCSRTTLANGRPATQIVGTRHHERLVGTRGADIMVCGAGNDRAGARGASDVIRCGAGHDLVVAGAGRDRVYGGPGDDRLDGGLGGDLLAGGGGRDRLRCGRGRDRILAGRRDAIARDCERRG
jgi:endoglycosylceramidase